MTNTPDRSVPHSAREPRLDVNNPNEFEFRPEYKILYLGTLGDLGLGNSEQGIPSELSRSTEEEKLEYANSIVRTLRPVTDPFHLSCIDGRGRLKNLDGTSPQIRRHQVGGTSFVTEVAMYSNSPLLRDIGVDTVEGDIDVVVDAIDEEFTKRSNIRSSSHLGGCGGANGAIQDGRTIEAKPEVMSGVEVLMNIPDLFDYSGIVFDDLIASEVRRQAGSTSDWLAKKGWTGDKYVERVRAQNPFGTEDLFVSHTDDHHGHKEPAILAILNVGKVKYAPSHPEMQETGLNPPFIWHLDASLEMSKYMCRGMQSRSNLASAFMANLAKHVAVSDRLASPDTPIFFVPVDSVAASEAIAA